MAGWPPTRAPSSTRSRTRCTGWRGGQAQAARLAARRHVPGGGRRRHRAGRPRRRHPRDRRDARSTPPAPSLLFGISALYHRGHWSPRPRRLLKRLDHSNIFLIIAGTYTPFSLILLDGDGGTALLWMVWAAALAGIAFRVLWVGAPRWLYTPVYIGARLGRGVLPRRILDAGGAAVVALLAVGGLLYSVGGVVYAPQATRTRRPGGSASTRSSTR